MHKEFADWYRLVIPDPKGETLELRWAAIDKFAVAATRDDALELARVFLGIATATPGFREKLGTAIRAEDAAFPASRNEMELRVLAGACCVACIETDDQSHAFSEMVAAAVVAGGFRRKRKQLIVPPILNLCEQYLRTRSATRFERTEEPDDVDQSIGVLKQACADGSSVAQLAKPLGDCLDGVAGMVTNVLHRHRLLQEETNVLWWLYGGYSRDLRIPFGEVEQAALAIIAAKELADLTLYLPGPIAIGELLKRVLGVDRLVPKHSVSEAINALPRHWRDGIAGEGSSDDIRDLCPVHSAMRRSLEVRGGKNWIKPAEGLLRVSLQTPCEAMDLALQVFLERILYRYVELVGNE